MYEIFLLVVQICITMNTEMKSIFVLANKNILCFLNASFDKVRTKALHNLHMFPSCMLFIFHSSSIYPSQIFIGKFNIYSHAIMEFSL